MKQRNIALVFTLFCLAVTLSGCGASISDTGYVGRWERMSGGIPSIVAIEQDSASGEYTFCWIKRVKDATEEVRCTGPNRSDIVRDGEVVYRYEYTTRMGEEHLFVDVKGIPVEEGLTPITWTDRIELQPGGLDLATYMITLNGEERNPPAGPYEFAKVSDKPR